MVGRIASGLGVVLLALTAWTAYANVFSDDAAVRATALQLARDTIGCKDCNATRTEGARGIVSETIAFTFGQAGAATVTCRRAYIAFGAYACTATK